MKRLALVAVLWAACAGVLAAQTRFDLHEVRWTLRPDPGGGSLAVEMRLAPLQARERMVLRIPLWRPGSYRYANYQERLSELRAVDQDGHERALLSLDPRAWEVDTHGATALTVSYRIATENQADPGLTPLLLLHGPATYLYTEDTLALSQSLTVELPPGWDYASGHRPDPEQPGSLRAPNYDVLVDCPMVLGGFERYRFEAQGKPFDLVLSGKLPSAEQFSRADWQRKVEAIVNAAYGVVGEFPFERYVFLFVFTDIGGGYGLEHLNSTSIEFNHRAVKAGNVEGLENVTAHEFFHLWNVKRIRPVQLGPFEYGRDVRTADLWWLEGVTSYYADVILQRAGMRGNDGAWFWQAEANNFRGVHGSPGWGDRSAERASWTVWEENQFLYISYYDQGQSLGLLLDLEIRVHTGNRRSLDDVVRFLFRWVDYPEPGYRPGDLERAVHAVTGWDCSAFFDRYVAGLVEYPWEEIAPQAGLSCTNRSAGEPYLGVGMDNQRALSVGSEGAAYDAGLRDGDLLQSLAGHPISNRRELREAVAGLAVGARVSLEVTRDGQAMSFELPVAERQAHVFTLAPDPGAPEAARAVAEGVIRGVPAGV